MVTFLLRFPVVISVSLGLRYSAQIGTVEEGGAVGKTSVRLSAGYSEPTTALSLPLRGPLRLSPCQLSVHGMGAFNASTPAQSDVLRNTEFF
jgi:hypothetical protein